MYPLSIDAFGVSISVHTEWFVIGPRDNGFPGPAVALGGPAPGPKYGHCKHLEQGSGENFFKCALFVNMYFWASCRGLYSFTFLGFSSFFCHVILKFTVS